MGNEKEWKPALAEAIDLSVLPLEYGGTAPPLAETPFSPAVHRALKLGPVAVPTAVAVAAADVQAGDDVRTVRNDDVSAKSMYYILRRFSVVGDGDQHKFERNIGVGGGGGGSGGSGGGIPFLMAPGLGSGRDGFESGEIVGGDGGGLCLPSTSVGATVRLEKMGFDSACKDVTKKLRVRGMTDENGNTAPPPGRTSSGTPSGHHESAPLGSSSVRAAPSDAAAGVAALPTSDDPRIADSSSSSSSSHVVIVGRQSRNKEGCNESGEEGNDDRRGDLEWILDVVPGARLAATVAGTVASATLGATLGAAGFAAGVVEAVVPDQVWADGVQIFQSAQFMGGWVLRQ